MSVDIYLSFSPEEQGIARHYVAGFTKAGFTVWDQPLDPGQASDKAAKQALLTAKAVVVLWSQTSVASRNVQIEAAFADRRGTVLPVMIENCTLPKKFELIQAGEMQGWAGDTSDPRWNIFLGSVRRFIDLVKAGKPAVIRLTRTANYRWLVIAVEVAVLLLAFAGIWLMLHQSEDQS